MNDTSGKGSSCLVLTEKKKNQRLGGCIGIFFQFFDWNKRLTKKRFFSKKLLPPAHAKEASSNTFKGDAKMLNSKLQLIASENNGGFPGAKKGGNDVVEAEQKHEMQVPGLVARLMGLESMPLLQQDKSLEFPFSDSCGDEEEKESLDNHSSEANNEEVDLEMVFANSKKHDSSRPRKIQKTGKHERRVVVTRFGSEALQIKKVLSRARKYNNHHQHKLVSPLNSRIASGKSASRRSRLIGAATKILEPGLQATSRAKCSLTSSTSINYNIVTERDGTRPLDVKYQCDYDDSTGKSLMGHAYCKSCGNLLDAVDYRPEVEGQQVVFTSSSLEKTKSFNPSHENDVVLLRSKEKLITLVNEDKNNVQYCNESSTRRMPFLADRDSSCQPCGTLDEDDNEEASSCSFKCKTQTQVQALSSERTSYGSRVSNVQVKRVSSAASVVRGTKDFVTLNRSLSGRNSMRSPIKVDSSKFDLERKPPRRQDDSSSPVRTFERKRTPNVSQVGGTASSNLVTVKQRNVSSGARGGTVRGFDASSPNSSNAKSKRDGQRNIYKVNENKVNEVVSFTFNSPFKQTMVIPSEKVDTSSDNVMKTCFQRPPPLTAGALGSFLEQKLKELSTRENEELDTDGPSKKSITMILQELISALNSRHLTCSNDYISNDKYRENHRMLLGTSCNDRHLSPGSVLEASFSSSSLDESSGDGFHLHYYMNCSYDQLEQLERDTELLDSATSFNKGKKGYEILTELINQVPRIMQSLNSFRIGLTESKLTHLKDVILNAELVLGNAIDHSEDEVPQLLISCFLFDELDTMPNNAMWTDFNGFVGCEESKEGNQLKAFVFDCVIEFLESNCCQYYNSVFEARSAWIKLPLCMKAKMLVQEFKNEIKKWSCIAGLKPDEIIEWEMSHSLGKWTDFNIEAFEAGVDIDGDVIQFLVDEIVQDLIDFRQ